MTSARIAHLADRGVVRVTGADGERLLQGIISNDMGLLASQPAIHAALLTPQGKILFDFFVVRADDGFLLETALEKVPDLVKRLSMYRLLAKATIEDVSDKWDVWAAWGADTIEEPWMSESQALEEDLEICDLGFLDAVTFRDSRLWDLGSRWIVLRRLRTPLNRLISSHQLRAANFEAYHAHRIALGVPEGGKDYVLGDTFPHEADLDQLNGVSFSKGCFVGQEVVSRMQNRGSVRKRVMPIEGEAPLTPGAEIKTGAVSIGTVGSVAGRLALALIRLDRAAEAKAKGQALTADGVVITLRKPDWASFDLPSATAAEAP